MHCAIMHTCPDGYADVITTQPTWDELGTQPSTTIFRQSAHCVQFTARPQRQLSEGDMTA